MQKRKFTISILGIVIFLFFSFNNINATDIKYDRYNLLRYAIVQQSLIFTMYFTNAAWLDAPVRGTVTVTGPGGGTVFEETVETSSEVPAYTEGQLSTTIPFLPDVIGDYLINIHVEPVGMGDIDESNNYGEEIITVFEPPPGFVFFPDFGLQISQIDFTFPGAAQENSSYGLLSLNWEMAYELAGFTVGYLNVSTEENWIVQNMPYNFSSGYLGLSTMFNLATEEDVTEIDLFAHLSEEPLHDFDFQPITTFGVDARPYNAQGAGMPVGNIPAPIPFESIPFVDGGKSELVWQHGHVTIEQDESQCAPMAVANSLQWLENTQGLTVPDDHKPGIRDNTLVGKLDTAMGRNPHEGVVPVETLNGKLKYLESSGVGDSLNIKHKNIKGGTILPNDTVRFGDTESIPNTDTTLSLIDWILQELDDDENVEMRIQWEGGGGHIVDLIGGGYVDGVPWISWTHDANQGFNNNGTPANNADDTPANNADDTPANNGGLSPDSGGVGWSYLINDTLVCFIGGASHRGTISYGISESKKEAVPVGIKNDETIPVSFNLAQNYPNPFNPTTLIQYSLPITANVRLTLYDILGRQVGLLTNEEQSPGNYEIIFNAEKLASGIYIYQLRAGRFLDSKKMVFLK